MGVGAPRLESCRARHLRSFEPPPPVDPGRLCRGRPTRHHGCDGSTTSATRLTRCFDRLLAVRRPDLRLGHRVVRPARDQRRYPGRRGHLGAAARIPHHIAMELLLTGRRMDAVEAHRGGWSTRCTRSSGSGAGAGGGRAAGDGPPLVFAAIKEALAESQRLTFAEAMRRIGAGEFPTVAALYASEDQLEGARAFAEKRPPDLEGMLRVPDPTATGTPTVARRPPPRRVHRTAAGRPRPGAGVQPPAGARRSRSASTSPTPSPSWTRTRCATCGWTRATARSRPSSPRPPLCSTSRPGWSGRARGTAGVVAGSRNAARPSIAARGDRTLVGWLEWQEGARRPARRRSWTRRHDDGGRGARRPLPPDRGDHRRRHALAAVRPSVDGGVGVWACRFADGPWSEPEAVSSTDGPSFNQEVVRPPRRRACTCAGRAASRTGSAIFARRWPTAAWAEPVRVSDGCGGNVWDPTLAADPATAWPTPGPSTPTGSYAVAPAPGRRRRRGGAGPPRSPAAPTTPCTRAWPRPPTAGCGAPST